MASSEWMVGVQIQHFEKTLNTEIGKSNYCCCDDGVTLCGRSIDAIKPTTYKTVCHLYYMVHFQACPSIELCYVARTFNVSIDLSSEISSFVFQIPFNQSELEM